MSDYISREAAINWIYELIEARRGWKSDARGEIQGLNAAMCAVEDIPAADVVLGRDFRDCRNELCLRCGEYKMRHKGACDGCRWRDVGE